VELSKSRFLLEDIEPKDVALITHRLGRDYPYTYSVRQWEPIRVARNEPIDYLEALIYNHPRFSFKGNLPNGKESIDLGVAEWEFNIAPLGREFGPLRRALATPWHDPTHVLRIRPTAGGVQPDEIEQAVFIFREFLSFAWGRDIGIALAHGYNGADLAFAHWGTTKLSPIVKPVAQQANWFEPSHAEVFPDVLSGFWRAHTDPDWKDTVEWAVYWYLSASAVSQNSETSLLASQAGLESLGMKLIQNTDSLSTIKAVKNKYPSARNRIRRTLDILGIPLDVPNDLARLMAQAVTREWEDGPQALADTRNSLAHPKKGKEARIAFEAAQLGLWYLELALLGLFDYRGPYCNRTILNGLRGATEPVPWEMARRSMDSVPPVPEGK